MANLDFRGDATLVAEVVSLTPAAVGVGNVFTATINGRTITYQAADTLVATVTAALTAAWNIADATDFPEHSEITAADNTTHVTLTADAKGVPFCQTDVGESKDGLWATATGGSATLTLALVTAAEGPSVWCASNFRNVSTLVNKIPGAGDSVWIRNSAVDLLYGLEQSGSGTIDILNIDSSYTGRIGLPKRNTLGDTSYDEYRPLSLAAKCTTYNVGAGTGSGSSRIQLQLSSDVVSTLNVFATGSSDDAALHAIRVAGGQANCKINQTGGSIDISPEAGATAEMGGGINVSGAGICRVGGNTVVSPVNIEGSASVALNSTHAVAATTITMRENATLTKSGTGTVARLDVFGGVAHIENIGTITDCSVGSGTTLDASGLVDTAGVTITNDASLGIGCSINDPAGRLAYTAIVRGGGMQDVNIVTKQNTTFTVT